MKEEMTANGVERVDVWRKGVDSEKFDPKFKSAAMRSELSDGHPEDPLLLYVGRVRQRTRTPMIVSTRKLSFKAEGER